MLFQPSPAGSSVRVVYREFLPGEDPLTAFPFRVGGRRDGSPSAYYGSGSSTFGPVTTGIPASDHSPSGRMVLVYT